MTRRAGRPKATTHEAIRAVAMTLFLDQGYAQTSMDQVARTAGIGRSTLFDYYPTKSALFLGRWGQLDDTLTMWLAQRPSQETLRETVRMAVHYTFGSPDQDFGALSKRLQIVQAHSDLAAAWITAIRGVRHVMRTYLAGRLGCHSEDFFPAVHVDTLFAAGEAAMSHIAKGDSSMTFDEALDRAIEPILDATAQYRRG